MSDLSPRSTESGAVDTRRPARNWWAIGLLVVVLAAGGVIVTKFLTEAVDYYCNVDEIGVRDGCEEERRVRIQGTVDQGSVANTDGATDFTISFNEVTLPVHYNGEPGGIFKECIPVVVHGVIEGGVLEGDRVEVKHSDEYVSVNDERLDEADAGAEVCESSA